MQPHEERVVKEQADLNEKINKLNAFIGGDIFNGLPEEDRALLEEQSRWMSAYSGVLRERIKRFKVEA